MPLTPAELHTTAPLGSLVTYSDGTKQPPARFAKKLNAWKSNNGSAFLTRLNPGGKTQYDHPHFVLTHDPDGFLVINRIVGLNDAGVRYDFTPPAPGTILAYTAHKDDIEVRHVWPSLADAQAWATAKGYNLLTCGYRYFVIADNGERQDYTPVL